MPVADEPVRPTCESCPRSALWFAASLASSLARRPPRLATLVPKVARALRSGGWRGLWRQIEHRRRADQARNAYRVWVETHDTLTADDRRSISEHILRLTRSPLISVVMPVYNTDERWLRRAIESVLAQLYTRWELCIADDASSLPHVRLVLEEYARADARIRVVYRAENGHISRASNSALALARGEFIALLDHDDELPAHALYMIAAELEARPDADLIYSDEDKIDERGERSDPHFKPDYDPDLFLSLNMISHLGVYRASLLREIGGFRAGYEGSQDYDLALRVVERTAPERIRHIPHVLYHWRLIPGSTSVNIDAKDYAHDAARRALADHLARRGVRAEVVPAARTFHKVEYEPPPAPPLVTLVVRCDGDRARRDALRRLLLVTDYRPLEVLSIDDAAGAHNETIGGVAVRSVPGTLGAAIASAGGEVLCFVEMDARPLAADWLRELTSHALRPEVGAAGAKLYNADDTVFHAGYVLNPESIASRAHAGMPRREIGHIGRAAVTGGFSAVDARCLATRREVYDQVGGFGDAEPRSGYGDVDYCLRLRARGYRIILAPHAELYRGGTRNAADQATTEQDRERMRLRWADALRDDPHYNPNLRRTPADFVVALPARRAHPWRARPAGDG